MIKTDQTRLETQMMLFFCGGGGVKCDFHLFFFEFIRVLPLFRFVLYSFFFIGFFFLFVAVVRRIYDAGGPAHRSGEGGK